MEIVSLIGRGEKATGVNRHLYVRIWGDVSRIPSHRTESTSLTLGMISIECTVSCITNYGSIEAMEISDCICNCSSSYNVIVGHGDSRLYKFIVNVEFNPAYKI